MTTFPIKPIPAQWRLPLFWSLAALGAGWLAWQRAEPLRLGLACLCLAATVLSGLQARRGAPARPARRNWRARALLGLLLALTLVMAGTTGLAYTAANLIAHPARTPPACQPEDFGLTGYAPADFTTSDGLTLHGWHIPARNGATVIFVHGLNRNRCRLAAEAAVLARLGYGALLYDSRNAGVSDGTVTTLGATEKNDVLGAVRFLRSQPGGASLRLGAYGHSMGGASVALAAAESPDIEAVVIASSFSSMEENVASAVKSLTGLPPAPFAPLVLFFGQLETGVSLEMVRPDEALRRLGERPALILHGEADTLLSPENARRLYAAAPGPRELVIVPGMSHWCCLLPAGIDQPNRAKIENTLADFWQRALPGN